MPDVVPDEALAEGLKQARKKPRNFAIIAKGSLPLKLMVQKKRFRDGELLKAKSEAKGNAIITGVLVANGPDYAFQVVGEEPTLKPLKLKELIAEQADMTVKPRFEVVTDLPEIGEDEQDEGEAGELESAETAQPQTEGATALAGWQAARAEVISRLKALGKEIAEARHAESAKALIELKAVIANLTAEPSTLQQVSELERYLEKDSVVLDVCEMADDIRTPLLAALAALKPQLSA